MSVMLSQPIDRLEFQRVASSMQAAQEFEGTGRIIHDSYDKASYIKRRHGFLGKHPDFKTNPKLLPKVSHEADEVFKAHDELSVEQVRKLELACDIEPLLPLPTTSNTATLDNFRSTGTKEWTLEIGHPTHFSPSPEPSPRLPATKPTIGDHISPEAEAISSATFTLGESVSDGRGKLSSVRQSLSQRRQTVTAGPDPETPKQQTNTNTPSRLPSTNMLNIDPVQPMSSAMDTPRLALNAPEDSATMQQIMDDLGKPDGSLGRTDCPLQYQQRVSPFRKYEHGPLEEASALTRRAVTTAVKLPSSGTKRPKPIEFDEADANASGEDQSSTTRPIATKKPRQFVTAQEDPPAEKRVRLPSSKKVEAAVSQAAPNNHSATSSVSEPKSTTRRDSRATQGGKALPQQSGSTNPAPPVPRRQSYPAIANGNRLPKTKTEAADAAVERKQALMVEALSRNSRIRHPDLGPEFFDTANFTRDEKDPNGDPPIRCVCGAKTDDQTPERDWIGCDNEECRVWQHVDCMGEGVPPEKKRATSKYLCQQCDPLLHKKLIQRLRKAQVLS